MGRRALAAHLLPGTREVLFGVGGGLLEIRYAPTGFLLVPKEARHFERETKLRRKPIKCRASLGPAGDRGLSAASVPKEARHFERRTKSRRKPIICRASRGPACNAHFGRPLVPYFQPLILATPRGPWYLGEDYAFCERARRSGHSIFADTTIRLRHYGRYGFSWEESGSIPPRYATYRFKAEDVG